MYFLQQLKKFNLPKTMMLHFDIIESVLTSSLTIWYAAGTAKDKSRLQRIIRTAEKVIGCNLPTLEDLHTSRTLRRAWKIVADSSNPGHTLFQPLPSGRRLRSIRTNTTKTISSHRLLASSTRPRAHTDFNDFNHNLHNDTLPHCNLHHITLFVSFVLFVF